jgi:hypothetical protein
VWPESKRIALSTVEAGRFPIFRRFNNKNGEPLKKAAPRYKPFHKGVESLID